MIFRKSLFELTTVVSSVVGCYLGCLQPVERSLKQTVLETSPYSTVGWAPSNQPDQSVPHLYAGTRVVGIFVPAAPTKRYHPSGSW